MYKKIAFVLLPFAINAHARTEETPSPQQVIVNGSKTDLEAGRDFVAGKIIIGKLRIAESGVQNAGELLRREPAISIGKDGRLGLLGMPGYTQILVDGAPFSGDPFSIDLVHIEKIEIIKATTAATGPVGIAGTINIVRKKTERQAFTNLRMGSSSSAGRLGADIALSSNQLVPNGPFSYNLSLSASRKPTSSESRYVQTAQQPAAAIDREFEGERSGRGEMQTVIATTELAWTPDTSHKVSFSPDAAYIRVSEDSLEQRRLVDGRLFSIWQENDQPMRAYSLPLRWDWRMNDDSRLSVKLSLNRSRLDIDPSRVETWFDGSTHQRSEGEQREMENRFLNLDFSTQVSGGHAITAGAKFARNEQDTVHTDFIDGQRNTSLAILGSESASRVDSGQLFMQDEWRMDPTLALNLGASVERRVVRLNEGAARSRYGFNMWSPSAHLSKKIGGNSKRQFRFSLARSYQAPNVSQMLLRPTVKLFNPCPPGQLCGANRLDTADSSGNPHLQPERALGLNLSYTHGLGRDSELVLEFYARDIEDKIGFDIGLESVPWAEVPRYVYRPANLGEARVRGVNLEGRLSARDVWRTAPDMEMHGSLGWAHSELSDLPGPDNRVAGQSPWRAKLGGSYTLQALPLKLGIETSYLPGDWVRNNLSERVYQSSRFTLNGSANWKISQKTKLTANLDRPVHKTGRRIDEYSGTAGAVRRFTDSTQYPRVSIRLERKL